MRQWGAWTRGVACALSVLAAQVVMAEGFQITPAARNWAWDQVKAWRYSKRDARGQSLWENKSFFQMAYPEQTDQLLDRLQGSVMDRRAALIVLSERPLDQWARPALRKAGSRDEVAMFLYARGFKSPDKDPYAYLDPAARLERPWTEGMGLHLDPGEAWRFQWIPSPALLPKVDAGAALPKALQGAPQPSVLLHFRQLRPGLLRLQSLAGGQEGLVPALAHGSRMGFLLRHLEPWLRASSPALEPLAGREAWVLHYGLRRDEESPEGTLVFLPGDLPIRAKLALELLKLNPTSLGSRARTSTWQGRYGGKAEVTQVRGSGGVLTLATTPEGTWISDREDPLRAVLFPVAAPTLAERAEWCRTALAGMRPQTEVSFWLAPRLGAGAVFERVATRRRMQGSAQGVWNNPFIAKAAPRAGTFSMAIGAGPTEIMLNALFRKDADAAIEDPEMPVVAEGGQNLTPEQQSAYQTELQVAKVRRADQKQLREQAQAVVAFLDPRGAALTWKGWVQPPELSSADKAAMAEFRKLQKADPFGASKVQGKGKAGFFGGYGEPGMTPSIALAVPVQAGKGPQLDAALKRIWTRLFEGKAETREYAKGVLVHRIRTNQAFTPSYALVGDTLVVGSDEAAVQSVAAGLLGQTTTLADLQGKTYGLAQIDGASAARDLEGLLLAYLRVNQAGRYWWWGEPSPTDDEAAAELASTFGPFLGALKALGSRTLELEWTSGGLEARPK